MRHTAAGGGTGGMRPSPQAPRALKGGTAPSRTGAARGTPQCVCDGVCRQGGAMRAGRRTRARAHAAERAAGRGPVPALMWGLGSAPSGRDLICLYQIRYESSIPHECRAYIPHESRASGPLPYGRGASSLGVGVGVGRGGGVSSPPASASSGLVTAMRRRAQTGGLRETPAHKPVRVFQSESSTPSESADGGTGGHAVSPSLFCNPKAVSPSFF